MKIFFRERYIELVSAGASIPRTDNTLYVKYDNETILRTAFSEFEADEAIRVLIIGCEDVTAAFIAFKKIFRVIEAAGGLVQNEKGEHLLIFRHNRWDLPKGKLDKGELAAEAAIREVKEECGISGISIIKEISSTWHIYELKGEKMLKHTRWYAMRCTDTSPLVPQTEEDITDARWMKKSEVEKAMENTYPLIKALLESVLYTG